jgi:protein SCO1/2
VFNSWRHPVDKGITGITANPQKKSFSLALLILLTVLARTIAPGQQTVPSKVFTEVGLDQKLGAWVPLDISFRDEQGKQISLQSLMTGKPVILSLVYYECPMICTEVLNGMVRSFSQLSLDLGRDYDVITVSINPREQSSLAASKKEHYLQLLGHPEASNSWHFLTGDSSSIKRLADAVGFRYVYDETTQQYAHPTGITVLTSKGQIARYLYGVDYPPKDLKFALIEASQNTVGSAVDQVLMLCYKYDPLTGKYGLIAMNLIRGAGVLMIVVMGGGIAMFLWRERKNRRSAMAVESQAKR